MTQKPKEKDVFLEVIIALLVSPFRGIFYFFKERKLLPTIIVALFLGPFIGMLYLNKGKNSVLYLILATIFPIIALALQYYGLINYPPVNLLSLSYLIIHIIGFVHCVIISKNRSSAEELNWYARWYGIIIAFIIFVFLISYPFRIFILQSFDMTGGSMKPNLNIGDYVVVSKYEYGYGRYSFLFDAGFEGRIWGEEPKRGDIIAFRLPNNPKISLIKRVVGLPQDKIQMKSGILYINDQEVSLERAEDFIDKNGNKIPQYEETLPNNVKYKILDIKLNSDLDNTPVYTVPKNHYFVMGDNRDNSSDSRLNRFGYIPFDNIEGKVYLTIPNRN